MYEFLGKDAPSRGFFTAVVKRLILPYRARHATLRSHRHRNHGLRAQGAPCDGGCSTSGAR